ncbi:hypothetical protein EYF80_059476 [Liparis tanakae]|uniref:Uncharacterized protein n=1 Tax=Liparis tanakae TaxID=230148 RepID=A0A4Z2EPA0_9TELE|nr:hypothetical protein EYF80_059476 [Liparis tanakae]
MSLPQQQQQHQTTRLLYAQHQPEECRAAARDAPGDEGTHSDLLTSGPPDQQEAAALVFMKTLVSSRFASSSTSMIMFENSPEPAGRRKARSFRGNPRSRQGDALWSSPVDGDHIHGGNHTETRVEEVEEVGEVEEEALSQASCLDTPCMPISCLLEKAPTPQSSKASKLQSLKAPKPQSSGSKPKVTQTGRRFILRGKTLDLRGKTLEERP